MAKWFPVWFKQQFFLKNGKVNANGWIEVFIHGTTNHAPTYNFNDEENANPISLDPNGRCQLKLSDTIAYDFVVYDEDMAIDDTIENVRIPISDGGGTGTNDHSELINRDKDNQHQQSAITGLPEALSDKLSKTTATQQDIKSKLNIGFQDGGVTGVYIWGDDGVSRHNSRVDVGGSNGYIAMQASSTDTYLTGYRFSDEAAFDLDVNGLRFEKNGDATEYHEQGVNFEINPDTSVALTEGQTRWNSTDKTLDIGMGNNVTQQVGQELPMQAKNVSGTQFVDGQIGYVFGASGQRISMKKPTASDMTALKAMFMATQIVDNNNTGFFNAIGLVRGVNTIGFTEGAEVWLDTTSGVITATAPAKPNYQARMGYIVNVHATQGSIFFHPDVMPKIGDLSDCNSSLTVQGDFLTKGSDGIFKPNVFYDDWRWAGTGVNPLGVPVPAVLTEIATNEYHWVFSNNSAMAFPDQQMPHDYKEGTDIIPHIHFVPTTTATYTGTWTAVITLWNAGSVGSTKTTYTRTASFNKSMTAFVMERLDFDSVISGTGRKISCCGTITLTLTLTAGTSLALLGLDAHYQKDRFGSNSATSK